MKTVRTQHGNGGKTQFESLSIILFFLIFIFIET